MPPLANEAARPFIPSEIILQILSYIPEDSDHQPTLYSCCLVSRRWNQAATPHLYAVPRLSHQNFLTFADTICPPLSARRRKTDLGMLVRQLDMRMLQYHSTNSLTARLLGRVKDHLERFHAPPKSFSINSLIPLSKCQRLQTLDLSLVTEHIGVSVLSNTFAQLTGVTKLHLSRSISRDIRGNCRLPPNLTHLQTNGNPPYSSGAIPAFTWPETLTSLSIIGCEGLSPDAWPEYRQLTQLYLIDCFSNPRFNVVTSILWHLTNLVFLSLPGRSFDEFFGCPSQVDQHPLKTIEMGRSMSFVGSFPLGALSEALQERLNNLRCLRVHAGLCVDKKFVKELDKVEELLIKHAEVKGEKEAENDEIGVVFFD